MKKTSFIRTILMVVVCMAMLGTLIVPASANNPPVITTTSFTIDTRSECRWRLKYSIVETSVSGYTATNTVTNENGAGTAQESATASGTLNAPNSVAYVNDAPFVPATGISMNDMLPFAGIAFVCLGAAAILMAKKRSAAK